MQPNQNVITHTFIQAIDLGDEAALLEVSYSRVAGRTDRCLQEKCWSLFGQLSGFGLARPGKGGHGVHSPHDTGEQTRSKDQFQQ